MAELQNQVCDLNNCVTMLQDQLHQSDGFIRKLKADQQKYQQMRQHKVESRANQMSKIE